MQALWRGHVFLFDRVAAAPAYREQAGRRLLLLAISIEAVRLTINALTSELLPVSVRAPFYLAFAVVAIRAFSGLSWSQIGFRHWRDWNQTEKAYFIQVILIANAVFLFVFAARLQALFASAQPATWIWGIFVPYLFYGFYQELVYRGLLQTELVRRWGTVAGILMSNALYTFGPLHSSYLSSTPSVAAPMFAAIFAIGLVFAVLFKQSGNLWIVGVMHAIGNAYMVGSLGPRG